VETGVGGHRQIVEGVPDGAGRRTPPGAGLRAPVLPGTDRHRVVVAASAGVPGGGHRVVGEVGAVDAVERAGGGVLLELVRREPAAVDPLVDGLVGAPAVDLEGQDAVHRQPGRRLVHVVALDRGGAVRAAGGGEGAGEGGVPTAV